MFAILSGLGHGSVKRLKQTWDKLPAKHIKMFEVTNILQNDNNDNFPAFFLKIRKDLFIVS